MDKPDELADTLTEMNIFELYEEILPLITHKHAANIFETALSLSLVRTSNENIRQAVQRASKIVFALKKYSHQNAYEEMTSTDVRDNIDTVLTIYYNQIKYGVELVKEYQDALKAYDPKAEPGFVSLEGYMVGKLTVMTLAKMKGDITRENFMKTVWDTGTYDLGGIKLSFGKGDNQGMDKVFLTQINEDGSFRAVGKLAM